MQDSWCSPIWDGTQTLYGAAAREYRLSLSGGVETVIRNAANQAAEIATRQALETINGVSVAVTNPKSNVVPMDKSAARPRRSA